MLPSVGIEFYLVHIFGAALVCAAGFYSVCLSLLDLMQLNRQLLFQL
jgi:hypothetical protein